MIVRGSRRGRLSSSDEMGFKKLEFMRVARLPFLYAVFRPLPQSFP